MKSQHFDFPQGGQTTLPHIWKGSSYFESKLVMKNYMVSVKLQKLYIKCEFLRNLHAH